MFDEAEGLDHPYFMTKHESEKIVRKESKVPWTVYRPALVVGDSRTGEMDKIDGPYYFFKLIQRMRQLLPPWMPAVGLEGGRINIVPVDFVVAALDHISHLKSDLGRPLLPPGRPARLPRRRRARHLQPAAHAPKMNLFVNAALLGFVPKSVKKGLLAIAPVRRVKAAVLKDLGLARGHAAPSSTSRPATTAAKRLPRSRDRASSARSCPITRGGSGTTGSAISTRRCRSTGRLRGTVAGKVVLVTGGSSGIGLAAATKFAEAGAITVICARDEAKLAEAKREIVAKAGKGAVVETYLGRHCRRGELQGAGRLAAGEARRRRLPRQQRRPIDPPRDRGELRPLP